MIKVYLMDVSRLPDLMNNPELLMLVSKDRKEKIQRYKKAKDRKLCLGAGILLKQCLDECDISVEDIQYGMNGKPKVDGVHFNLSHSNNLVVCAISNQPVGCDIEKVGKAREGIAEHFFTEKECQYLSTFEDEDKTEEFYRLWTIKESYMKMTGEGSGLALNSFEIMLEDGIRIQRNGKVCDCHVMEYEVPGYKLTVCGIESEFAEDIERRDKCEEEWNKGCYCDDDFDTDGVQQHGIIG